MNCVPRLGTDGSVHMCQMAVCYSDLWVVLSCSEIETTLLYLSSYSPSSMRSTIGSQQLNWSFLILLLFCCILGPWGLSKHVVHFHLEDVLLLSNRHHASLNRCNICLAVKSHRQFSGTVVYWPTEWAPRLN